MAVVGDARVEFHGDTSNLDRDIETAVKRIKNKKIGLEADLDVSKASKKIRDMRYRNKNNPVEIALELQTGKFDTQLNKKLSKRHKIYVDADTKGVDKALDGILRGS